MGKMPFAALSIVFVVGLAASARAGDPTDPGLGWHTTLDAAVAAAQKLGRPILIEEKRPTCGNCQAMAKTVLVDDGVRATLDKDFVCIAVDTDHTPPDVDAILRAVHGVGKSYALPCFVYLTPDQKVIKSTNGFRTVRGFKADLLSVLASDSMCTPPEAEKHLASMVEQAAKDLDAKKYTAVIQAAREAETAPGWCKPKLDMRALLERCAAAEAEALDKVAALAKKGSYDAALAALEKVRAEFEGTDAERGVEVARTSLDRLAVAANVQNAGDAEAAREIYDAIVKDAAGTAYEQIAQEKLAKLPKKTD